MAFESGSTSDKYCWTCMAILPIKLSFTSQEGCSVVPAPEEICSRCSKEIKPPEEKDEKNIHN